MSAIAAAFRTQSERCALMQSPLCASMLDSCARDIEAHGAVWDVLSGWAGDPDSGFLPLRFMAAIHALVLSGRAPDLEPYYLTVGGALPWKADAWGSVQDLVRRHNGEIRQSLQHAPQTNDVRRSGPLLLGFLEIARQFALPLSLREFGSSAGLNLLWDRFRYSLGEGAWGDPNSPVHITAAFDGPLDRLSGALHVSERRGCDLRPLRVDDDSERLMLESYFWGTEVQRLRTFRAAANLARIVKPEITAASADDWIVQQLTNRHEGQVTVVFHSAVWPYIPSDGQKRILRALAEAGAMSNLANPLAWLRLEDDPSLKFLELWLTVWPGGEDRLLATVHPRTRAIRWRS